MCMNCFDPVAESLLLIAYMSSAGSYETAYATDLSGPSLLV